MRRVEQVRATIVKHGSPARSGRRYAETEKAHGSFGENSSRHANGGLHNNRLNNIGEDVADDHAQITGSQCASSFHKFTLPSGKHLRAHQTCIANPASKRKR